MTKPSTVIMINSDGMGHADQALQHTLIEAYLRLILESGDLPDAIAFYTDGVKLVVNSSPVLQQLKEFQDRGVLLIVCSTCLNHFQLMDELAVGIQSHMPDIIALQQKADKVITL